jgi:hypothetical protein
MMRRGVADAVICWMSDGAGPNCAPNWPGVSHWR